MLRKRIINGNKIFPIRLRIISRGGICTIGHPVYDSKTENGMQKSKPPVYFIKLRPGSQDKRELAT